VAAQPTLDVVVALIGVPEGEGDLLPEGERLRPYAQRRTVHLEVDSSDDYNQVLQAAATAMGVRLSGNLHAFYQPRDERPHDEWQWSVAIPLVDEEGRARWAFPFETPIPYVELLRSAEAGALPGDPLRPYVVLVPAIGDGILPAWHDVLQVFDVLLKVLGGFAALEGAAQAKERAQRLLSRGQRARKTIDRLSVGWDARGADPWVFSQWLDDRPWLPEDIAPLLDCSPEQAEAVLWAFGFAKTDLGLWRRCADTEAELLWRYEQTIINTAVHAGSTAQIEETVRDIIGDYLESGEVPNMDMSRTTWLSGFVGASEPRQSRRLLSAIGRWLRERLFQ
jgi:hypothetical protein